MRQISHTDNHASQTAHTPEPWTRDGNLLEGSTGMVATLAPWQEGLGDDTQCLANAARIVACVNACAGLPTAALEAGVIQGLVKGSQSALTHLVACDEREHQVAQDGAEALEHLRPALTELARVKGR